MDGFFLSHQNKLGQPQKCTRILRQRSWLCAASDFLSISAHRTEMRGRLNPMELIQHTNTPKKAAIRKANTHKDNNEIPLRATTGSSQMTAAGCIY